MMLRWNTPLAASLLINNGSLQVPPVARVGPLFEGFSVFGSAALTSANVHHATMMTRQNILLFCPRTQENQTAICWRNDVLFTDI